MACEGRWTGIAVRASSFRLSGFVKIHPEGVIPKLGAFQPSEGSPLDRRVRVGDPSLRPKNGYAQDDANKGNSS